MNDNKLSRKLNLTDMLFTGIAYMVCAGIFTLMPYVIQYGKKNSVLAFLIGGIVCILTSISFSKLNYEYPFNDAEYSWIIEILKNKKDKEPSKEVKGFAAITIWTVGLMGVFALSLMALGMWEFFNTYKLGISKKLFLLIVLVLPTIINMVGVSSVADISKVIICIVIATFVLLYGVAGFKGKTNFIKQNSMIPDFNFKNGINLLRASFLTIYTFTGFQSVVQLSEETVSDDIIPKSIIISIIFTTVVYCLLIFSVISLIGIKGASNTVYPVSKAFQSIFGNRGRDYASVISMITIFSSLVIGTLGASRLFHKLAEKKIAPQYLSKLDKLDSVLPFFKNKIIKFDNLPILALVSVFIVAYLITFIKGGILELVANFTNSMLAFIFAVVNLLVIISYYKFGKSKKKKINSKIIDKLFNMYPWYAVIGFLVSFLFLVISPKFYDIV